MSKKATAAVAGSQVIYMDVWMELNRSISIFNATTKILAFSAVLILTLASHTIVHNILRLNHSLAQEVTTLSESLSLLIMATPVSCIIVSLVGIYGFATLKRQPLAFYNFYSILFAFWTIYFVISTSVRGEVESDSIDQLFENASKNDIRAIRAMHAFQLKFECCGSKYKNHSASEHESIPSSCCKDESVPYANITRNTMFKGTCRRNESFKTLCDATRITLSASFNVKGTTTSMGLIVVGFYVLLVINQCTRLTFIPNFGFR